MPKNADGYFRRSFVIGKTEDGKQKRITLRAKTKRELDEKTEEAKRLHSRGIVQKNATVAEWAKTWLRVYKANTTTGQQKMHEGNLRIHILPVIGDIHLRDVRASVLQEFLNDILFAGHS